jgi:hypothetical protein
VVDPSYNALKTTFSRRIVLRETRVSTEPFDYNNRLQKVSNQRQKFRFAETALPRVQGLWSLYPRDFPPKMRFRCSCHIVRCAKLGKPELICYSRRHGLPLDAVALRLR